jgi:hypothetical protein
MKGIIKISKLYLLISLLINSACGTPESRRWQSGDRGASLNTTAAVRQLSTFDILITFS